MTKNGIIGLSLSTVGVLAGLTFYTDSVFNQQIENMLPQMQQNSVEVALESKSQGMLSGDAQYMVLVPAQTLRNLIPNASITEPLELYINHHHSSYPLFVKSEITLDFTKGTVEQLLHDNPELSIEHLLTINTNILFQSNTTTLVVKPIEFEDKNSKISIGKVNLESHTNFSYDSGDFTGTLEALNMDFNAMGKFSLSGLTSTFDINVIDGMLLTPSSTLSLDEINFVSESRQVDMDLTMKDLSVISGYENLDSDALDMKSVIKMDYLDLTTNGEKYNVIDTVAEMTIDNIDKAGLIAIDKASKNDNYDEILNGIGLLLKRNIHGEINQLNTNINQLVIKTNGDFSVAPYEGNDIYSDISQHFITQSTINYDINLSNNYTEVFPQFSPMIDALISQKFITKDDKGNISTILKMANGAVTANGTRIR